jgi:hypothetical protein
VRVVESKNNIYKKGDIVWINFYDSYNIVEANLIYTGIATLWKRVRIRTSKSTSTLQCYTFNCQNKDIVEEYENVVSEREIVLKLGNIFEIEGVNDH